MTVIRLHPRFDTAFLGWQFTNQPPHDWPSWVQQSCAIKRWNGRTELRWDRRSGAQIVRVGEWLVKDIDGEVLWFTDAELNEVFTKAPPVPPGAYHPWEVP